MDLQAGRGMPEEAIRLRYVTAFTRLSLWYVHRVAHEAGAGFADVVNRRVNIYRNTAFYDGKRHPAHEDVGPAWAEVLKGLEAIHDRHRGSAEAFESEGLALLWPHIEARLRQDRGGERSPDRPYACWTFDYGGKGDRLNLHIANVYRPRSPLSDMKVPFAASLIRLLLDSRANRPDVEMVRCGSWLNGMPAFRALFPERWAQSARLVTEVRYGMGYWGQFTDRRGDFHARNGAALRETGRFPFPCLTCECPIEEALAHLRAGFPEAVAHNRQISKSEGRFQASDGD